MEIDGIKLYPIKGYDKYFISKCGKIYSEFVLYKKGRWLKYRPTKNGYNRVGLHTSTFKIDAYVHKLVAEAFIPNPENKPQVNHINCIKKDNRVENLEWCTVSENAIHAYKNNLISRDFMSVKVLCTKTNILYNSIRECAEMNKISKSTLRDYLNGKVKNKTQFIRYKN